MSRDDFNGRQKSWLHQSASSFICNLHWWNGDGSEGLFYTNSLIRVNVYYLRRMTPQTNFQMLKLFVVVLRSEYILRVCIWTHRYVVKWSFYKNIDWYWTSTFNKATTWFIYFEHNPFWFHWVDLLFSRKKRITDVLLIFSDRNISRWAFLMDMMFLWKVTPIQWSVPSFKWRSFMRNIGRCDK